MSIVTGVFLVLSGPAIVILCFSDFVDVIQISQARTYIFYIMILGVLGTGIANILFFRLIQISSPVFASSVTYLVPLVAFCWSILDKESMSFIQLIGASVILIRICFSSNKN